MKRYNVSGMRLYYPSIDIARHNNPDVEIAECDDYDYLVSISKIKGALKFVGDLKSDNNTVKELYVGRNKFESIEVLLFKDPTDNLYYDYVEYRRQVVGRLTIQTMRDVSNPQDFCKKYLHLQRLEYHVITSLSGTIPKPKELKGIKPLCSVVCEEGYHGEGQTTNQHFRKGNDLWIKAPHYFDPCWADDNGTHLYRRMAWCVFRNFFDLMDVFTPKQMSVICAEEISKFHRFGEPLNMEWQRYLERMCNQVYTAVKQAAYAKTLKEA